MDVKDKIRLTAKYFIDQIYDAHDHTKRCKFTHILLSKFIDRLTIIVGKHDPIIKLFVEMLFDDNYLPIWQFVHYGKIPITTYQTNLIDVLNKFNERVDGLSKTGYLTSIIGNICEKIYITSFDSGVFRFCNDTTIELYSYKILKDLDVAMANIKLKDDIVCKLNNLFRSLEIYLNVENLHQYNPSEIYSKIVNRKRIYTCMTTINDALSQYYKCPMFVTFVEATCNPQLTECRIKLDNIFNMIEAI